MSKKKHKKDNSCCCCNNYGGNGMFGGDGIFGGGCEMWQAILFWLIACGAGLLNTNSILIILLFLLYGWSETNCGCNDGYSY
ncbi:hypothetical protein NNC19_05070 [Clostridium sp. SHJSY1]|uniref:hypothetical protein n=1 Tax=Clostridium sp. SHJSY1 TaxID=2942483 RepID=UPI002875DE6A|nr:hypothetical protein [Clostridium sp. SHJSY1]MDS0525044.1 hypothetical protein [Clostridium sp. SHJSY1]